LLVQIKVRFTAVKNNFSVTSKTEIPHTNLPAGMLLDTQITLYIDCIYISAFHSLNKCRSQLLTFFQPNFSF